MINYMAAGVLLLTAGPMTASAQELLAAPQAVQEQNGLTNEQTRVGYAVGYVFGTGLKHDKFEVDLETVLRGMKDGMTNQMAATNMLATQTQARAVVLQYRKELEAKATQERLELGRRNRELGRAFCETNAYREGVSTLPSGLQFRVLKQGEGPLIDTNLVIHTVWRGTLIDGTEFQDTRKQTLGSEFRFWNQYVMPGFAEALPMMRVGDRWEIVMPADLAYGDSGDFHSIKPGDTLIYALEVVSMEQRMTGLAAGGAAPLPADANAVEPAK